MLLTFPAEPSFLVLLPRNPSVRRLREIPILGRFASLVLLVFVTIGAVLLGISVGAVAYSPTELLHAVLGRTDPLSLTFRELRLSRVGLAAGVGSSLALSGALLQGVLRNPLVDPYLTGSSAGAALAVAVATVIGIAPPVFPVIAFVAAIASSMLTIFLARGRGAIERVILAGISFSALCAAIVTLLITLVPSQQRELSILAWLGGSLAGRGSVELAWVSGYVLVGTFAALLLAPTMNVLRLGPERAAMLGVNVRLLFVVVLVIASLLTAAAVSVSGTLGFVGLIVPHAARRFVGQDARYALPATALLGASIVVLADAAARTIVAPVELPLGAILALVGVPAFTLLLLRTRSA